MRLLLIGMCLGLAYSCIYKGNTYRDGEEWSDGRYIRKCKILSKGWDYDIVACIIGGKKIKGGKIFVEKEGLRRKFLCSIPRHGKAMIKIID